MLIGYECFLTGPAESGVGGSIRQLLCAMAGMPGNEFCIFSSPAARWGLPANGNVHYEISGFAGTCRAARVAWQHGLLPRRLKPGLDVYHATGGAAILLDPADARAWVEGVEALIESEEARREWRERGLKRVAGLTWESAAGKVLETYGRAIREGWRP